MGLVHKRLSAVDRLRILAQKNADEVLLLLDSPLKVRYVGRRGEDQLLGLAYVEHGGGAAVGEALGQFQRALARLKRLARDLEFKLDLAQRKIAPVNATV